MIYGCLSILNEDRVTTSYHERSQIVLVLLGLDTQILEIEVTICVSLNRYDLQTSHNCRLWTKCKQLVWTIPVLGTYCRVRAVSADRDQADIPVALSARLVIRSDNG